MTYDEWKAAVSRELQRICGLSLKALDTNMPLKEMWIDGTPPPIAAEDILLSETTLPSDYMAAECGF